VAALPGAPRILGPILSAGAIPVAGQGIRGPSCCAAGDKYYHAISLGRVLFLAGPTGHGAAGTPVNMQDLLSRWGEPSTEQLLGRASQYLPFWISLVAVVAIAWYLARLAWLLYPMPDAVAWQPPPAPAARGGDARTRPADYSALAAAHLFGEAGAEPAAPPADAIDAPDTRLNLTLRAAVATDDAGVAHAIIADGSGDERVYFIGASIPGGATLRQVYADRVILNRGGVLEALRLPRDYVAPQPTARAARRTGTAPTVQQVVQDNAATLTEIVRPQPFMPDGQMRGYRVYPGRNRQQFAALGLRPGDLVTEINGMALNNPAEGMQIFQSIASATQVSVTIERAGQQQVLTLDTSQLGTGSAGGRR